MLLEALPLGPNVSSLLGHSDLRTSVLGLDRATTVNVTPTNAELEQMADRLEAALDAGMLGMSGMDAARADGFRPAIEFLIASAAMMVKDEGAQFLSLSGAPLAHAVTAASSDSPATGVMDRSLDLLGRTLEPVYGFRSLLAFKSKFQPEYSPMYMAFPDPAALASIGSAITKAYLPELSTRQSVRLVTALLRRS
mgnify:CR=1 FL=1